LVAVVGAAAFRAAGSVAAEAAVGENGSDWRIASGESRVAIVQRVALGDWLLATGKNDSDWRLAISDWSKRQRLANCWSEYQPRQKKQPRRKKNGSEWRLATGEWSNGSDGRLATGERQRRANCWSGYQPRQKKQPRRKTAAATTKTISHDGKPKRMG
jgi:hypothetical protein